MAYLNFFFQNQKLLLFGVLLTFFSSFGQTFLISVFVPHILTKFSLNSGQFGTIYSLATLCSAAFLPFFGRLLDKSSIGSFALGTGLALLVSCWLMALSPGVAFLFAALLGLRISGQGLMGLTASTAMARLFTRFRGRALSISATGYALGEGLLPLLTVLILHTFGWHTTWLMAGFCIALVFLPLSIFLIKDAGTPAQGTTETTETWSPVQLLGDARFYLILPGVMAVPFLLTGIFLYQTSLADFKGYTPALMASGFTAYAVMRMFSSIAVGPWIDRMGGIRLFPFSIVPLFMGLLVLWTQSGIGCIYLFFILAGASQGISGILATAVWAEVYGVDVLGQVKSLSAMVVVFSTALSPALFGWLIASNFSFSWILPGAAAFCILAFVSGLAMRRIVST
ncbi:MFS transporter [Desulfobotulus sp. H1]|uniref:MFS transporter n=1 Tax=Desulfobotulus pelophilus TaxID=2823377 RepID=A0ABT3N7R8_9BACT|nr:MFS transporter [Desulfobotulus pelophilus]MCW7753504.1 MFS transporter [Desulfobotulus pelophilus]